MPRIMQVDDSDIPEDHTGDESSRDEESKDETYPTWAVNLWIGNDEGSYVHWREQAEQALVGAAEDKADRIDFPRSATAILAENLREHVRRNTEPMRATLGADLIGHALDCVDWHEIARALVENAREENVTV